MFNIIFNAMTNLLFLLVGYFLCLIITRDKANVIEPFIEKTFHRFVKEELEEAYVPEED
jgi:hypothetical protein